MDAAFTKVEAFGKLDSILNIVKINKNVLWKKFNILIGIIRLKFSTKHMMQISLY